MNTHKVLDGDNNVVLLAPEADCLHFAGGIPGSSVRLATGREVLDSEMQREILVLNGLTEVPKAPAPPVELPNIVNSIISDASATPPTDRIIWWCEPCRCQWDPISVVENDGYCANHCGTLLVPCALVVQDLPPLRRKHISEFLNGEKTSSVLAFEPMVQDMYHESIQRAAAKLFWEGYKTAAYQTQYGSGTTLWRWNEKTIRVSDSAKTAVIL